MSLTLQLNISVLTSVADEYLDPTEGLPTVGIIGVLLLDLTMGKVILHLNYNFCCILIHFQFSTSSESVYMG